MTVTLGLDGSGKVDIVAGGYEDWVKQRSAAKAAAKPKAIVAANVPKKAAPATKLSYKDQRDLDRLPAKSTGLEREITKAEEELHDPDLFVRRPDRFAETDQVDRPTSRRKGCRRGTLAGGCRDC